MAAPTIVLLHGQPDYSVSLWALRAALYSRLGDQIQIMTPDRPGYGANPLPATDFIGNVRWLEELLRPRAAGPVIVVGHSWAGGIALLAAARKGVPLAGLVLLASVGPHCLLKSDAWLAHPVLGEIAAFTSFKLARRLVVAPAANRVRNSLQSDEHGYARTNRLAMAARPVWRSFLHEQRALIEQLPMLNACLVDIQAPTLVLSGSSDAMIPVATPAALATEIADSRRVTISGAGHDLHVRRVAEVAEHIALFARPLLGDALCAHRG